MEPPSLLRPPLPEISPAKVDDPVTPVLSVAPPSTTPPLPASVPRVSLPPSARVAPASTLTAGLAVKRPAKPRLSVPALTVTLSSWARPLIRLPPDDNSAPVPRLASTVPLDNA